EGTVTFPCQGTVVSSHFPQGNRPALRLERLQSISIQVTRQELRARPGIPQGSYIQLLAAMENRLPTASFLRRSGLFIYGIPPAGRASSSLQIAVAARCPGLRTGADCS